MPTNMRPRPEPDCARRQRAQCGPVRQRGVVVLTFLLLALSISSYVLLQALNSGSKRNQAQIETTHRALMEAKRALLGYAVAYADGTHAPEKGPGHLPCPDLVGGNEPGVADTGCSQSDAKETGRLPFRTLGLTALDDGTGAPLWYAVSEAHRSVADPPLNSDTPGTLTVDDQADVVAVIIAPGAALSGQARGAGTSYNAADYLEDDNASTGDGSFSTQPGDAFNDQVVRITRAELANAIEKTVIGEVANALENYFGDPDGDDDDDGSDPDCGVDTDCDDGFPWLAALDLDVDYPGLVDDFALGPFSFGRLPLVRAGEPLAAEFLAAWDVQSASAVYAESGIEPPSETCLRRSDCFEEFDISGGPVSVQPAPDGVQGVFVSDVWQQGTCTLSRAPVESGTGQLTVRCNARRLFPVNSADGSDTRKLRRDYQLDIPAYLALEAPTATARRTLVVQRTDSWTAEPAVFTITDYELTPAPVLLGSATLTVNGMSAGDKVALSGVPFDLEVSADATVDRSVSPGELPAWFWANAWHELVFVQYARSDSPGDAATDCAADGSCFSVNVRRPGDIAATVVANVRGVVLGAGPAFAPPAPVQTRPSALRAAYLEGANAANAGLVFDRHESSAIFNDQVMLLEP